MTSLTFEPATSDDFEPLLDLRLRTIRPHLERLGRYDPDRAREWFQRGFSPAHTRLILVDGARAGCVTLKAVPEGLEIEHFYLEPAFHNTGLGGRVLRLLLDEADAAGLPVILGVLKESPAARLYQRHGFVKSHEGPWDDYYRRAPGPARASR